MSWGRLAPVLVLLAALLGGLAAEADAQPAPRRSSTAPDTKRIVSHRTFTRADGLPHATNQALAQAPDGRLWIGTNARLVVYDGHQIRPAPLPDSLEHGFVCTLWAQADGTVWTVLKGRGIVALRDGRMVRVEPHLWEGEGACVSGLFARGDTAIVATEQSFRVVLPEADTVFLLAPHARHTETQPPSSST